MAVLTPEQQKKLESLKARRSILICRRFADPAADARAVVAIAEIAVSLKRASRARSQFAI